MKSGNEKFDKNNRQEAPPEKEKRLAHEIEKLPASVMEIVNLMLVWRGLKPWTKLTYVYKEWGAGDPEPDLTPNRKQAHVQDFNRLLGFIGLSAVANKIERKEPSFEKNEAIPGKEYRDYYIAAKMEIAEEMANQSADQEKFELTEQIKSKIQQLSPDLYTEMIKALEER